MKAIYKCENSNFPEWLKENASANEIILIGSLSYRDIQLIDVALENTTGLIVDIAKCEEVNYYEEESIPFLKILQNKRYADRFILYPTYILSEDGTVYIQRVPTQCVEFPCSVRVIGVHAFSEVCKEVRGEIHIPNHIEVVGDYAFECSDVDIAPLPDSIREIGYYAFEACAFKTLHIPSRLKILHEGCFRWVYACSGQRIVVPEGVERIETEAFSLTDKDKLFLPSTLRELDDAFFYEVMVDECCPPYIEVDKRNPYFYSKDGTLYRHGSVSPYLGRVYVNKAEDYSKYHYTHVPEEEIGEVIVVPEGKTHLDKNAFEECLDVVRKVLLPQSLVEIADEAFKYCSNLEEVVLPNNIRSIGASAFLGTKVREIDIPDTVQTIGEEAFKSCERLSSVRLPIGLKQISKGVFSFCPSLKSIALPNGLMCIGENAFHYSNIELIDIPSSVQEIKMFAFCETKIRSITIPEGITIIPARMCNLCRELEEITLPSTVEYIDYMAFAECPNLRRVVGWNIHIRQYNAFQETPLNRRTTLQNTVVSAEWVRDVVRFRNEWNQSREGAPKYLLTLPESRVQHFEGENKRSIVEKEYEKFLREYDPKQMEQYYYATIIRFLELVENAEDDLNTYILDADDFSM